MPAGARGHVKKPPSFVVDLNGENFDTIVKDPAKNVLVEFYAPCKLVDPLYVYTFIHDVNNIIMKNFCIHCIWLVDAFTIPFVFYIEWLMLLGKVFYVDYSLSYNVYIVNVHDILISVFCHVLTCTSLHYHLFMEYV